MLIIDEIEEVICMYPRLVYNENTNSLTGTIEVFTNDSYEIKIELVDWKKSFPKVFEINERIPNHLDRHIYPKGNFCFTTTAKEQILLATDIRRLIDFMNHILIPYLKNNSYYEIEGSYRFGEYSHNDGILEGYKEILGIQNNEFIIDLLKDYCKGIRLDFKDNCFCKSGKKLIKCSSRKHYKGYKKLRHINSKTLKTDVVFLITEQVSRKMELYQMLLST